MTHPFAVIPPRTFLMYIKYVFSKRSSCCAGFPVSLSSNNALWACFQVSKQSVPPTFQMAAWHLCASAILPNQLSYQGWAFILFPRGLRLVLWFLLYCVTRACAHTHTHTHTHYKHCWNDRSKLAYFLENVLERKFAEAVCGVSLEFCKSLFKTPSPRLCQQVLISNPYRHRCLCLKVKFIQSSKGMKQKETEKEGKNMTVLGVMEKKVYFR